MPVATPAAALGSEHPTFALRTVFGMVRHRDVVLGGDANLVVFFCNHCPYAMAVEDRLIALHLELAPRGLRTVLICSNDPTEHVEDAPDALKARAIEKDYPFPYLIDETQDVARAFDAACTPDPYLYDRHGRLIYRGRIDDNWKRPSAVTKHELREAIEATLEGRPVSSVQHPSLGCSIKWKR
jgi:hypothetical protein